jgi:uncharacterized protein
MFQRRISNTLMKNIANVTLTCFILIGFGGCSPLAPRPDHSRFFILTPVAVAAHSGTVTSAGSTLILGIGPIDFPGYLRRPEVVTVTSANEVDLSDDNRWAEPLDKNFSRILTENLARLVGTSQVEKYPWSRNVNVDYQVVVDVQTFDTTSDRQSQLVARWAIKDGHTGRDLFASETSASTPVASGDGGASAALSADLAILSKDIADRIAILAAGSNGNGSAHDTHETSSLEAHDRAD